MWLQTELELQGAGRTVLMRAGKVALLIFLWALLNTVQNWSAGGLVLVIICSFLANCTIGRAFDTVCRLSVVCDISS